MSKLTVLFLQGETKDVIEALNSTKLMDIEGLTTAHIPSDPCGTLHTPTPQPDQPTPTPIAVVHPPATPGVTVKPKAKPKPKKKAKVEIPNVVNPPPPIAAEPPVQPNQPLPTATEQPVETAKELHADMPNFVEVMQALFNAQKDKDSAAKVLATILRDHNYNSFAQVSAEHKSVIHEKAKYVLENL